MKEIHVRVEDPPGATPAVASIHPGDEVTLPPFTAEGEYVVTSSAVDALGNTEAAAGADACGSTGPQPPSPACRRSRACCGHPTARLVRIADVDRQ